jgi:hypothetical protein
MKNPTGLQLQKRTVDTRLYKGASTRGYHTHTILSEFLPQKKTGRNMSNNAGIPFSNGMLINGHTNNPSFQNSEESGIPTMPATPNSNTNLLPAIIPNIILTNCTLYVNCKNTRTRNFQTDNRDNTGRELAQVSRKPNGIQNQTGYDGIENHPVSRPTENRWPVLSDLLSDVNRPGHHNRPTQHQPPEGNESHQHHHSGREPAGMIPVPKSVSWDIPFRDPITHIPPENDNRRNDRNDPGPEYPPEYPEPDAPGDPTYEDERNVPPTDPEVAAATPADPLSVAPQTAFPIVKEKSSKPAEPFIADGIAIPGPSHVDEVLAPPNSIDHQSKKGFFKSAKSLWTSMTAKTPESVVKQKRKTGKTTDETVEKKQPEQQKEVEPSEKKEENWLQKKIKKGKEKVKKISNNAKAKKDKVLKKVKSEGKKLTTFFKKK